MFVNINLFDLKLWGIHDNIKCHIRHVYTPKINLLMWKIEELNLQMLFKISSCSTA